MYIDSAEASSNAYNGILGMGLGTGTNGTQVTFRKIRSGISNNIIFSTSAESLGVSRSANDTGQWLQLGATKSGSTIKFYINAELIKLVQLQLQRRVIQN